MTSTIPEKSVRVQLAQAGDMSFCSLATTDKNAFEEINHSETYVRDVELAAL